MADGVDRHVAVVDRRVVENVGDRNRVGDQRRVALQAVTPVDREARSVERRGVDVALVGGRLVDGRDDVKPLELGDPLFEAVEAVNRIVALVRALLKHQAADQKIPFEKNGIDTLKIARTLLPDLESRIEIMENSIALLMGKSPDWEVLRGQMNIEAEFPDSLPVGLPSGLLQRRPDVRASEQQLRSAMASAGMAYADRFPRLTFNLVGGWENDALQGFFRSPFSYVAAAIAAPVFGFGRKQAKYRAALAAYDVARLGYEKKVLEVFKEANDAVVTYRNVRKTAALKVALRDAARKYVELANLQYRGGSINYIDVLDAQRRYFDAQIGLSNAVRDEHLALVQLYKALGGGWGVVAE